MLQAVGHHQAGRLREAEGIYRQVLKDDPRNPDAMQLLGLLEHQSGKHESAVELIRKAITISPRPEFFVNLSQAYKSLRRLPETLEACQRAVQLGPTIPEAWNNLGGALKDLNQPADALKAFERAVQLRDRYPLAWNNIGNTLMQLGRAGDAESALRRAIAFDPRYAEAYSNLGFLLTRLGRLDEAVQLCMRAIALKPDLPAGYMNVGTALHLQGRMDEGNEAFRRGVELDPANHRLHENLLGAFTQTTRWSPSEALSAHVEWARRFASPTDVLPPPGNDRNPDRKLRIGYVSPDLRRHSVAYFLEPILEQHDRSKFEIFAYANVESPDNVTDRLRGLCDQWRDVVSLSDSQLAEMVRADKIDVLVDLAGHTNGNRLLAFAYRPAPVQMTYLGYATTTGVGAIDYRLTDEATDPTGVTDAHYTEKLIRLSEPFLCYRPPENAPAVVDPPMLRNGYVTFGSFNRASKAGAQSLELWGKLLNAMPASRLLLKSRGLGDAGSRKRILDALASFGVSPERVQLIEANQGLTDHLAMYGQIDLAVDTFPYCGTTTTCESLWMGVPVVSLVGQTHVSRVGLTLLRSVGLESLAQETTDGYTSAARDLTNDADRLVALRAQMRDRLRGSPLFDAARLTRSIEAAYLNAFGRWAMRTV